MLRTSPRTSCRPACLNITNLGLGGQCHLDQFAARMMRDSGADLLSMKVGINVVNADTMRDRTFMPALHGFIDTVREGAPDTPFVIVSPILYIRSGMAMEEMTGSKLSIYTVVVADTSWSFVPSLAVRRRQ